MGHSLVVGFESFDVVGEVVPGPGPVEGLGGEVVAVLEAQDPVGEGVEVGGFDGFVLQDGEVDLVG